MNTFCAVKILNTFCAVKILMLTVLNNVTQDLFHDTNGHS